MEKNCDSSCTSDTGRKNHIMRSGLCLKLYIPNLIASVDEYRFSIVENRVKECENPQKELVRVDNGDTFIFLMFSNMGVSYFVNWIYSVAQNIQPTIIRLKIIMQ